MTAATAARPVLVLDTLDPIERPYLTINGERFDYAVPGDFGIVELNRIDQMSAELDRLQASAPDDGPLPPKVAARLTEVLELLARQVIRAPASVIAALTDVQRLAVLKSFTAASTWAGRAKPKPNRATRRARRTGATSSRGSRASTARATG